MGTASVKQNVWLWIHRCSMFGTGCLSGKKKAQRKRRCFKCLFMEGSCCPGRCHTPQVWIRCSRSGSVHTPVLFSFVPPDSEEFVVQSATSSVDRIQVDGRIDWQGQLKAYRVKQAYLDWTHAASTRTPTRSRYPMDLTAFTLDLSALKAHMEVTRALGVAQVCVGVARVAFHVLKTVFAECVRCSFDSAFFFYLTMHPKGERAYPLPHSRVTHAPGRGRKRRGQPWRQHALSAGGLALRQCVVQHLLSLPIFSARWSWTHPMIYAVQGLCEMAGK